MCEAFSENWVYRKKSENLYSFTWEEVTKTDLTFERNA